MPNILFVCTGNTCRSVMAEALMRRYWEIDGCGQAPETASAGLAAMPGDRASAHVRDLISAEGVDLEDHTATLLDQFHIRRADLILVMTRAQREQLLALFPEAAPKVHLLKEYAENGRDNPDISDPFGGSREKNRQTLEEIRESITKIIEKLKGGGSGAGGPG